MDITYHGISGCVYAEYAGRPALLAPEGCGVLDACGGCTAQEESDHGASD